MQSQMREGATKVMEVTLCCPLVHCHAPEVIYVAQSTHSLHPDNCNYQGSDVQVALHQPSEANGQADINEELPLINRMCAKSRISYSV